MMMVTSRKSFTSANNSCCTMKQTIVVFCVVLLVVLVPESTCSRQQEKRHVIRKRFLFNTLLQLAQPFIRRPKAPPQLQQQQQQNNPYYRPPGPYPAPPVFQVQPSLAQPVQVPPPSSGQLYLPMPPGNANSHYQPSYNAPPVYVPPSSYGQSPSSYGQSPSSYGQSPSYPVQYGGAPPGTLQQNVVPGGIGDAQWKPMADGLYYEQVAGGAVGPPSVPFPTVNSGGFGDGSFTVGVGPTSGVVVSTLLSDPFRGSSVFLAASDKSAPEGFVKVTLPTAVLHSVSLLDTGLDAPTIYLARTSFAPSQDFVLLDVTNDTLEALQAAAQQPNSSRAAELPPTAAEDLLTAIKTAAPRLVGNATTMDLDELLSTTGFTFDDLTGASGTGTSSDSSSDGNKAVSTTDLETGLEETDPPTELDPASDLPSVFLARRDADVPADYIRVLLPDDILRELRRRVTPQTLRSQEVSRPMLTEAYLAPGMSTAVKPSPGIVPVHLSREALQTLNHYANEAEKLQNAKDPGPQLELPRSVLEQLSKDKSQRVHLRPGGRETAVKTGSTDVFIGPSDKKPPDGYVSIPLPDNAMQDLKKNFLGTNIQTKDVQKGIPVRAYIAPADQKLPAGHVAVPLPDSVLDSIRASDPSSRAVMKPESTIKAQRFPSTENAAFLKESDSAIFLAPARKTAPVGFRKLKLPETIMDDLRSAVPAEKLAEAGTPAKDLTAAYLASANEFVPPGFLSMTVPDTLVKMLDAFSENREPKDADDATDDIELPKSSSKNSGRGSGGPRLIDGEEGSNLSRKIFNALLEAAGRTASQVFKGVRGEQRNRGKSRGSSSRGGSRGSRGGSASRDNARSTTSDNDDNEFDKSDVAEDGLEMYQPQYQVSPFFQTAVSGYPYVDPYQYSGLWAYGDGGQAWSGDANQWAGYTDYAEGTQPQDRDSYYYGVDGQDGSSVQYADAGQYDPSAYQKRQGESAPAVPVEQ